MINLIFFFALSILSAVGFGLALVFLQLSGWLHVPTDMKRTYHAVREKLHEAGWG